MALTIAKTDLGKNIAVNGDGMRIELEEVNSNFDYFKALRHRLHENPELGLNEIETAKLVADELTRMGYAVTRQVAGTGVVASLKLGSSDRSIGLRADMDALPVEEQSGVAYASKNPGIMHACGHDGHVATLLCAANAIAMRRNFDGTVHLIFQPAEENAGGADLMIRDGLFERFPCDVVFGMHNDPKLPVGRVSWRHGAVMAAVDSVKVTLTGSGGHEGLPHLATDTIVAAASIIMALQTIVARNIDPTNAGVLNVAAIHSGTTSGIMPSETVFQIGLRSLDNATRDQLEERMKSIILDHARGLGVEAQVEVTRWYGPTINNRAATDIFVETAKTVIEGHNLVELEKPFMFSEDFSYMLDQRPGSYFFIGGAKGHDDQSLHHPSYNFNDEIIRIGGTIWTKLVEDYLSVESSEQS